MKAARATLITGALLLGVWALLGVIGLIAGVLPDLPGGGDVAVEDAGVEIDVLADAGAVVDAGVDAPDPEEDAGEDEPDATVAHPVMRFRICDYPTSIAHGLDWSFVAGELLAGGPPELVIGCADRFVVVGIASGPAGLMGMRLGEIELESARDDVAKHTARAEIADVTGDGKPDLLLPFFFESDGGGSRGGRLVLWSRAESGFARPRSLGQHTFQNVTAVDLDGRGGTDFVAVDRGRPWASAAGAVRFFQGGTQSRQRAQHETGISPRNAVVVDIDQDGEKDIVTSSSGFSNAGTSYTAALHVLRRTGPFQFEHTEVPADRHWGLAAGDLDDDGHDDVVIGGSAGLAALHSRTRTGLEGLALEPLSAGHGAPVPMAIADVDGDGLNDVIVHDQAGLSWLARTQTGFRGAQSYAAQDVTGAAMIQVDGTPVLVWVILEEGRLDLVVVSHPTFTEPVPSDAAELHDAPFLARAQVR